MTMYTKNDILARLQKGENAADIANEMADMLNAANDAYEAQKAAAEEKAKKDAVRNEDAEYVAAVINDFAKKHYDIDLKYTAKMVCDVMDTTASFAGIAKSFDKVDKVRVRKIEDADAIIDHFLKELGLK